MDASVADRVTGQAGRPQLASQEAIVGEGHVPAPRLECDIEDLDRDCVPGPHPFNEDRSRDGVDRLAVRYLDPAISGGEEALDRHRRRFDRDGLARPYPQYRQRVWPETERDPVGCQDV